MRHASLALAALALLLLLPAAQAQTQGPSLTFTEAKLSGAVRPGESAVLTLHAVRACMTTTPVMPAATLQLAQPTTQHGYLLVSGALEIPVPQHTCVAGGDQAIEAKLDVHAPADLVGATEEVIAIHGHLSQGGPTPSDSADAAITVLVPLDTPEAGSATVAAATHESPVLAPGIVLATLGALAGRKRTA